MKEQAKIYERAVPVSKDRHKDFCVSTDGDYGYARDMNGVPLLAAELASAAHEYPIIFSETDNGIVLSAMVGLRDAENLYVDAHGTWDAKYIPAFVRRYPFVFAHEPDKDTFTLCIDEGYSGCNQNGEGEPLFKGDGETSEYLSEMFGFTTTYERELQQTRVFCETVEKLNILTMNEVNFNVRGGKKGSTKGLLIVDKKRLQALPASKLSELARAGDLEKIYNHLFSLENMDSLGDRLPDPLGGLM